MDNVQDNIIDERKKQKSKTLISLKNLIIKVIVLALIIYVIFGVLFGFKRMETSYMSPKIMEGDLLLYYRFDKNYELADVVLLQNNGKDYVLRIAAKEGQTVDIDENGVLLIDGYPEENEAFYKTEIEEEANITFPYKVESGKYFVISDYRNSKHDSRTFGTVSKDDIRGKIIARLQIRNI